MPRIAQHLAAQVGPVKYFVQNVLKVSADSSYHCTDENINY